MQSCIYVYIQSYNGEETLQRAIESVLSQTYTNWKCILCDNGSTDKTKEIIDSYACKDSRISAIYEEENRRNILLDRVIPSLMINGNLERDMFCMLDADDEYYPEFFSSAIADMEEQNADIVITGSHAYKEGENQLVILRCLPDPYSISGEEFDRGFPKYHQFTRTIWGKLFRLSVLAQMDMSKLGKVAYGGDTVFSQEAFLRSEKVYIQNRINHRYYMSPKSVSHKFDDERIYSEEKLYFFACEYLFVKCGMISPQNFYFLSQVYDAGLKETLKVLFEAQIEEQEKIENIYKLVTLGTTKMFLDYGRADELCRAISDWIKSVTYPNDKKVLIRIAEIYTRINVYPIACKGYKLDELLALQLEIRSRWVDKLSIRQVDEKIMTTLSPVRYASVLSIDFVVFFRDVIVELFKQNEIHALNLLLDYINEGKDIPEKLYIPFINLILDIAACNGEEGIFIAVSKIKMETLVNLGNIEEAKKLMADWEDVLATDEEFLAFKEKVL